MIKSYRRNTAFRFFEATDVAYWRLHLTLHCKDMQGKFPRCSAFWHGITLRSQPVHGFGPLRLGLDDSAQDMVIIQAGWMVCGLKNLNANGSCNAAGKEGKKHVAWLQRFFNVSFGNGSTLYVWPHKAGYISSQCDTWIYVAYTS